MALGDYCTAAELKARAGITDTVDDTVLAQVITGVSRSIDNKCNRRFFVTATDETRYYQPISSLECPTGDIQALTSILVDAGNRSYNITLDVTDYDLVPDNAVSIGQPWMGIRMAPYGRYRFYPQYPRSVKVTGRFGYSSTTPEEVHEAALIQCARIFKRKDAEYGVLGSGGMGQLMTLPKLDPDVEVLLAAPITRYFDDW